MRITQNEYKNKHFFPFLAFTTETPHTGLKKKTEVVGWSLKAINFKLHSHKPTDSAAVLLQYILKNNKVTDICELFLWFFFGSGSFTTVENTNMNRNFLYISLSFFLSSTLVLVYKTEASMKCTIKLIFFLFFVFFSSADNSSTEWIFFRHWPKEWCCKSREMSVLKAEMVNLFLMIQYYTILWRASKR